MVVGLGLIGLGLGAHFVEGEPVGGCRGTC